MAKFIGIHKCQKCGYKIKWEYLIPQAYESNWEFTILDRSRVSAKRLKSPNEKLYRFRVTCRKCMTDNFFDHNPDSEVGEL